MQTNDVAQSNAGKRLLDLYEKLSGVSSDGNMLAVWSIVFDIDGSKCDLQDEAAICVLAVRSELHLARLLLLTRDMPQHMISPGFDRLNEITKMRYFDTSWNSMKGNLLTPDCKKCFDFAAWELRHEQEELLPYEEWAKLREALDALEAELMNLRISAILRDFISRQVNLLRRALWAYPIKGVIALQEAVGMVKVNVVINSEKLETEAEAVSESDRGVIKKLSGYLKNIANVAEKLSKVKKAAEDAVELGQKALPALIDFIDSLGK